MPENAPGCVYRSLFAKIIGALVAPVLLIMPAPVTGDQRIVINPALNYACYAA